MIERRDKWRICALCWRLAVWAHRLHLPWQWLFDLGGAARKCQYRVGHGAWQTYRSQAHLNAVRLFHGEEAIA